MSIRIVKVESNHPDQDIIQEAGQIIKDGGLVAFPTETVYGLGGNALDVNASHKIYAAKGRPSDNPLIIHIADMKSLPAIVSNIPAKAQVLARAYWPGPLTMIFPKSDLVPYQTTGGLESVAVRMPSHPVALALIRAGGGYIAAPSANTSGRPSPTSADHVIEDLGDCIDMVVDGGNVEIGLESTIVDFTDTIPTILRPGYISQEMLVEVLGQVRMDPGLTLEEDRTAPKAPGMKYKHYAPKAQLLIVEGDAVKVTATIQELVAECVATGNVPGVICTDETVTQYSAGCVKSIGNRTDEDSIARHLYGVLREFDHEGVTHIYSEAFYTPKLGQAIMNRLQKAAGYQIIKV